jgi:stage IV sporulation protein FB
MSNSWKLFNAFGVPVYLKYWFLLLFLLLPIKLVIAIFISVLIHEIAHSYVAKKLGYNTKSIILDFLFGSANIEGDFTKSHKDSIKISIAGPISNLLLSVFSILIATTVEGTTLYDNLLYFASINIIFFIMNMIPIFPLDGGRISKGILSLILGDKIGRISNGVISLVITSLIFIYAVINIELLLILFCVIFMVTSYYEIKGREFNTEL